MTSACASRERESERMATLTLCTLGRICIIRSCRYAVKTEKWPYLCPYGMTQRFLEIRCVSVRPQLVAITISTSAPACHLRAIVTRIHSQFQSRGRFFLSPEIFYTRICRIKCENRSLRSLRYKEFRYNVIINSLRWQPIVLRSCVSLI